MRTAIGTLLVLTLSGCGFGRAKFDEEFTTAYCDLVLECGEEAVLTFDGIESLEDCTAQIAPEVTALGSDCKFKRGKARKCVKALLDASCDAEGGFSLPADCDEVFKDGACPADPAETDADTDADADTDLQADRDVDGLETSRRLPGDPVGSYVERIQDLGGR